LASHSADTDRIDSDRSDYVGLAHLGSITDGLNVVVVIISSTCAKSSIDARVAPGGTRYRTDPTVPMFCRDTGADSNGIDVSSLTTLCHIYTIGVCPGVNLWLK
jgi:hypothetical protein